MGTREPPTGGETTWDKATWRAWARRARPELRARAGAAVDAAVARHVAAWEPYRSAQVVGAYLAFGHEVDLSALIAAARRERKLVVAPRAHAGPEPHLTLHELRPGDALVRHSLGQPEPPAGAPLVAPSEVDVFLVPGLAFDESGHRLGYGLGYFDRLLPQLSAEAHVVGVTPSGLLVPALPAEPHDARVTHLVTELGIHPARTER